MRPIKFRGIDWETGEYVYGDLIQGNYDEVCPRIKPRKKKARYVKDVAQLVGYDTNGKEVYEGDTVIWNDLPMTAKFITNISGGEVLKEDDQ